MSDTWKIVIGACIAVLTGFINYFIQFERNRKLSYKEKVRTINQLLIESFDFIKVQLIGFEKVLAHIPGNEHYLVLLDSPPYQALKYLQGRLLLDDYYIGFTRLFKQSTDSIIMFGGNFNFEQVYYRIKHDSVFLYTLIAQMDKFYTENYSLDFDRRTLFYKKYVEFKRELFNVQGKKL